MRTPEAIFEEVLDAWDERETAHILNTPYPGDRGGEAMDRHTERVRYLRQEFRVAMQKGVEATAKEGVDVGLRIGRAFIERPDERAERLASRYTRDDGSSR